MGLIPMLCGVLFPPAMLGVVLAMGRLEDMLTREPAESEAAGSRHRRRRRR